MLLWFALLCKTVKEQEIFSDLITSYVAFLLTSEKSKHNTSSRRQTSWQHTYIDLQLALIAFVKVFISVVVNVFTILFSLCADFSYHASQGYLEVMLK